MPKKTELEPKPLPDAYTGNIEAHIIADMLRIEAITTELREFKSDTKRRFDKIESWLVGIVAISFTSLVGIAGSLLYGMIAP